MTAAHIWFVSSDRWTCPNPDCNRTTHRQSRQSDDEWAARRRAAQERHARAHTGRSTR
jgi:hypothetical protein